MKPGRLGLVLWFPDDFPTVVPDSAIRKQCGNSVPVSMIAAVSKQIVAALSEKPLQLNGTPLINNAGQFEMRFCDF
jgi:hypothetical protein